MRVNHTQLSSDPSLEPFFKRIAVSPVKREISSTVTTTEDVKRPRARRQTKAREEIEAP